TGTKEMPDDTGAQTLTPARSAPNEALLDTLFLFGGNAAYLEELAARYAEDPTSVDQSWREFFDALDDPREAVRRAAKGPSWRRGDWPPAARDDMIAALTGDGRPDGDAGQMAEKAARKALRIAAGVKAARPELSADAV